MTLFIVSCPKYNALFLHCIQQVEDWDLKLFQGTFNLSVKTHPEHLSLNTVRIRTFKSAQSHLKAKILKNLTRKRHFGLV